MQLRCNAIQLRHVMHRKISTYSFAARNEHDRVRADVNADVTLFAGSPFSPNPSNFSRLPLFPPGARVSRDVTSLLKQSEGEAQHRRLPRRSLFPRKDASPCFSRRPCARSGDHIGRASLPFYFFLSPVRTCGRYRRVCKISPRGGRNEDLSLESAIRSF